MRVRREAGGGRRKIAPVVSFVIVLLMAGCGTAPKKAAPEAVFCPWNLRPYHEATPRCFHGSRFTTGAKLRPITVYGRLAKRLKGSSRGTASGMWARLPGTASGGPSSA